MLSLQKFHPEYSPKDWDKQVCQQIWKLLPQPKEQVMKIQLDSLHTPGSHTGEKMYKENTQWKTHHRSKMKIQSFIGSCVAYNMPEIPNWKQNFGIPSRRKKNAVSDPELKT